MTIVRYFLKIVSPYFLHACVGRKIITLAAIAITIVIIPSFAAAQVPQMMNYQGILTSADGNPVDDGDYSIRFQLYEGPESGESIWTESQTVHVANGIFNVMLGSAVPLDLPFDQPYYLGVAIGEETELSPRISLVSTAYSLRARSIDDGQAVRRLNELTDAVTIEAGSNITINTTENRIIISAEPDSSAGDQHWQRVGDNIFNHNSGNIGIGTQVVPARLTIANSDENTLFGLMVDQTGPGTEAAISGTGGYTGVFGGAGYDRGGITSGVKGTSVSESGRGVYGVASHTTGNNYGVYGLSSSGNGRGVYGEADASTGLTFGVQGLSGSTTGRGVQGIATASTGQTIGVYGQTWSNEGWGVYGWATSTTGTAYGLYGRVQSSQGRGVYGFADAATGANSGVFGESRSTTGRGVFGEATSATGNNFGVFGVSGSTNGVGVYGESTTGTGLNYGVYGVSNSTSGIGVYGETTAGSGINYAIYGKSEAGTGVFGISMAAVGGYRGVHGLSASISGTGVYGQTTSSTGKTFAVLGEAASPDGYAAYFRGVAGSKNYFARSVGIGTENPDAMLHLEHAGEEISIKFKAGGSWTSQIQQTNSSYFNFFNGGSVRMTIRANGHVGIGTEEPGSFRLAVNGDAAKPGGGSWSVFSDERLKRDIQKLGPGVLDRLLSIQGYTFEYLDEAIENRLAMPGRQTGLIAQEVIGVFPDWVGTDDDGYLYVTERGLTALLIEALRELRQEKDDRIADLIRENQELESRLERQNIELALRLERLEAALKKPSTLKAQN